MDNNPLDPDKTSYSSLPPLQEFVDEDLSNAGSSQFNLDKQPVRRTASMPSDPPLANMGSPFGRFTQQLKNRRSITGSKSMDLDSEPDSGPRPPPPPPRATRPPKRVSASPTLGLREGGIGAISEDFAHSFRNTGKNDDLSSSSYHGTRDSIHQRSYNRNQQRFNSEGSRKTSSRSPTRGVRRSTSLEVGKKSSTEASPAGRLSSIILPGSLGAKVSRRSQTVRSSIAKRSNTLFSFGGVAQNVDDNDYNGELHEMYNKESLYRGYSVGDAVLVFSNNRFSSCVNRFGFPPGSGRTAEEKTGPYLFVLGKVQQIHFEENSVFYTVRREDTDVDVRGTPALMEPIESKEGETAARKAAHDYASATEPLEELLSAVASPVEQREKRGIVKVLENIFVVLLLPFFWIYDCFVYIAGARLYRWGAACLGAVRRQALMLLNGAKPYEFSTRLTMVNFFVICSLWYIFVDQARLAFIPVKYDGLLAVVNFAIWVVLVIELFLEIFIRPDDYHDLIESDKAYTPTTVRYITGVHLFVECISLLCFIPEFFCLFSRDVTCDGRLLFSFMDGCMKAITGPTVHHALYGLLLHAVVRLRVFGLLRHWRNYWVNQNFLKRYAGLSTREIRTLAKKENEDMVFLDTSSRFVSDENTQGLTLKQMQQQQEGGFLSLINASNIGAALMVTNSYRAMTLLCIITGIFPMISLMVFSGIANTVATDMVAQLQGTNLMLQRSNTTSSTNCAFLEDTVRSWINSWDYMETNVVTSKTNKYLLGLAISPARCLENFESMQLENYMYQEVECETLGGWEYEIEFTGNCSQFHYSKAFWEEDVRLGNIDRQHFAEVRGDEIYSVTALFNHTRAMENSAFCSFLLQLCLVLTVIITLIMLRKDAKSFVLGPLRSMLKIVARYAKNPLSEENPGKYEVDLSDSESDISAFGDDDDSQSGEFQTDETEQLIRAVAKITDLLRKCWGVAGAGIISTNLASRETALAEVFNPTVPGKSVYALFAFAAINGFDHCLRSLGGDVMILINDVAAVLHREVFRWGFEDSGQCNKNLGEAFLMVFRIGLVKEVLEKLEEATKVVFSTSDTKKMTVRKRSLNRREGGSFEGIQRLRRMSKLQRHQRNQDGSADAMQLSLQSLPGISTFTDRAVIGMLKSFAGIHRDRKLMAYSRDFRLSAGVGTFDINMVFGMDAGWAVEGAVGSEYKIDATYLSPHVNMASRMMSACKHYGVTIMLSEAVQELMSNVAKSKLRSLDRVTVKGSTWVQKIYTYDARYKGADFFLFHQSDDLADMDAERYSENIWNYDQDLKAMQHHITEDFTKCFTAGMKCYLDGDWPGAIKHLTQANDHMIDAAFDEGYLHDETDLPPDREELSRECSDGPTVYLINFMKSQGGVAPPNWNGWHPLLSK